MKKEGFAATGVLYTILIIFLILMSTLLVMVSSRLRILNKLKDEAKGVSVYKKINDKTPPTDTKPSGVSRTNQITVTSNQIDLESEIEKIEYTIYKDNKWSDYQESNIFKNLKNNTTYKIKTRATNKAGLTSESKEESVTTSDIPVPTYKQTPTEGKTTITITYASGFTNSYSLDGGTTWSEVTGTTKDIEFTSDGSIIARSSDGKNIKNSSSMSVIFPKLAIQTATSNPHSITIPITIGNYSSTDQITCKYSTEAGKYTQTSTNVSNTECKLTDIAPNKTHYYKICVINQSGNKICKTGSKATTTFTYTNLSENIITLNNWYNGSFIRVDASTIQINVNKSQAFLRHNLTSTSGLINHKLYGSVLTKRSDTSVNPGFYIITSANFESWPSQMSQAYGWNVTSLINEWQKIGTIFTSGYDKLSVVMLAQANGSAIGSAYYKELIIVDLTATFGAGNEPSVTWCNKYIN